MSEVWKFMLEVWKFMLWISWKLELDVWPWIDLEFDRYFAGILRRKLYTTCIRSNRSKIVWRRFTWSYALSSKNNWILSIRGSYTFSQDSLLSRRFNVTETMWLRLRYQSYSEKIQNTESPKIFVPLSIFQLLLPTISMVYSTPCTSITEIMVNWF